MGNIFLMTLNTPNNIHETADGLSNLPENLQKIIIERFRELFKNPDFVKQIQEKIADIPEYVKRIWLMNVLNRITWLQSDAQKITVATKDRLTWFQNSLGKPEKPSTTA